MRTSSELNKELKALQDERAKILEQEKKTRFFVASTTEDPEKVRPPYNLAETRQRLFDVESQIINIKHRINQFNTTYVVPETGLTIDQILVKLPMLSARVQALSAMVNHLEIERCNDRYSRNSIIEYEYINYDPRLVRFLYDEAQEELSALQLALDRANTTVELDGV